MVGCDIQAGDAVSTKHKSQEKWIANNVVRFDENELIIEVTLKPALLESLQGKGDPVEIKIIKEDYIYSISGVVKEIIIDFSDRIKIEIEKLNKTANNRTETRYDVWLDCIIRGQTIEITDASLVINISKSGMGILSSQNLSINSEIFIDVQLGCGQLAKFKGIPVRKRANGYRIEYGISCEPVDGLNLILLNEYIEELEMRNKNGMLPIKKLRDKIAASE